MKTIRHRSIAVEARKGLCWILVLVAWVSLAAAGWCSSAVELFQEATDSYRAGDITHAALLLRESAKAKPSAGTLQNLGTAEWKNQRTGFAVLAWEQSLWVNPFNQAVRNNLRYARKVGQLEAPDLAWDEVVSSWLPVNWWTWIAGLSFWFAVGVGALPGLMRWRKAAWQQALAAFGLAVFLLSVPAQFGIESRSRLGFILEKNAPLRLTPTDDAQYVTRLQAGEPARLERSRGKYILLSTNRARGWVQKGQFGLICPRGR